MSKPILNNVDNWYGEIMLKILKEKLIKFIKIKSHSDISIMYPLGTKKLTNGKKKPFQKDFWKQGPILALQKVHNYHDLVEVLWKNNSHLTFWFHSSTL